MHGHDLVGIFFFFLYFIFFIYLGHVGMFLHGYGKNSIVVHGCVENLDCGEILVGHWF